MNSITVKLNSLTLGEYNEPISKEKWSIPLTESIKGRVYIL